MPLDASKYPKNWRDISLRIRERDGWCCKFCGVPNGAIIQRSDIDAEYFIWYDTEHDVWCYPSGEWIRMSEIPEEYVLSRPVRIVLTTAHLNHDTTDNSDENLAALCQLHHLRHDAKHHAANAKATRQRKAQEARHEAGQEALL